MSGDPLNVADVSGMNEETCRKCGAAVDARKKKCLKDNGCNDISGGQCPPPDSPTPVSGSGKPCEDCENEALDGARNCVEIKACP